MYVPPHELIARLNDDGFCLQNLRVRDAEPVERPARLIPFDRRARQRRYTISGVLRRSAGQDGQIAEGMILCLHGFKSELRDGICHILLKNETFFVVAQPPRDFDEVGSQHKDILTLWLALQLDLPPERITSSLRDLIQLLVIAGGFLSVGEPTALEASVRLFISQLPADTLFGEFIDRYRKFTAAGDESTPLNDGSGPDDDYDAAVIDIAAARFIESRIGYDPLKEEIDPETYEMAQFQLVESVREQTKEKLRALAVWFSTTVNPDTSFCEGKSLAPKPLMVRLNSQIADLVDLGQIFHV